MSDLILRTRPIDLDGAAFNWHPGNAPFAMMMNAVTFQVMGFEHSMYRAMRDAEKFITDPAVLAEARVFLPRHANRLIWAFDFRTDVSGHLAS